MKRITSAHLSALCTAIDDLSVKFESIDNKPLMGQMNKNMGSLRDLLSMLHAEHDRQITKSDNAKVKRLAKKILKQK